MDKPHETTLGEVDALIEEVIEDLIDIEEYALAGRPVPHAHRYRYRVNKQHFISETAQITREQILERANMVPTDQYRLSEKRRHGPPIEIAPGQTVDLHKHGIERFISQHCEVQDGLEARRQFDLPADDVAFLDSIGLRWEAIRDGASLWIIVYSVPVPPGYQLTVVDVAIQIMPGYPTSQLDMAYFCPPLVRTDGKPIPNSDVIQPLDGRNWQRWSRHRIGATVWVPGVDNFERHFLFMQEWLARENGR